MARKSITLARDMPLAEQEHAIIAAMFNGKGGRLMVSDAVFASAQRDVLETFRRNPVRFGGAVTLTAADDRVFSYGFGDGGVTVEAEELPPG